MSFGSGDILEYIREYVTPDFVLILINIKQRVSISKIKTV